MELLNDATAVALNYAMLRQFTDTTQHHVFYDMGAGGTVASLVAFKNSINDKKKRFLLSLFIEIVCHLFQFWPQAGTRLSEASLSTKN